MKEFRERRVMILMRLALFTAGGVIGAVAMWQALDVIVVALSIPVKLLCYLAAVLFLGGLLCLSAPPLRTAFHKFSFSIRKRFGSLKAVDMAGIAAGLFAGITAAFILELLLRLFLPIFAIRILIDAGLGLFTAYFVAIAVSGFVTAEQKEEPAVETAKRMRGYLLTESALCNPKIIPLCGLWLEGSIFVLSRTADSLASAAERGDDSKAYQNFKALYHAKKLRILEYLSDDILEAAEQKKLKIVTDKSDEKTRATKKNVVVLVIGEM